LLKEREREGRNFILLKFKEKERPHCAQEGMEQMVKGKIKNKFFLHEQSMVLIAIYMSIKSLPPQKWRKILQDFDSLVTSRKWKVSDWLDEMCTSASF
jgi:hypothetical protein